MPALVEYHPVSGLPMIEQAGEFRVLGCLPPHLKCSLPAWGSSPASNRLDPSQWVERNWHAAWKVKTTDQKSSQACVGHSTEKVWTYTWLQNGGRPLEFSNTYVYSLINGGTDGGAVISDAMTALKMYGIAEKRLVPDDMIFRAQLPAEAYANARRFRAVEVYRCLSFADIVSAISLGHTVASGIFVGRNFGELSSDGVAPLPDQIVGGHALAHVGIKYLSRLSRWGVLTQNSWSQEWGFRDETTGEGGFCYLVEEHWQRMQPDAWAVVGVQEDPDFPDDDLPVAR